MDEFRGLLVSTQFGTASLGLRPSTRETEGPVIVALSGLARNSNVFRPVLGEIERLAPVVFCELPGHGNAPPDPTPDLPTLSRRVDIGLKTALPNRPLVFFGESLGGLIALFLSCVAEAVVALDPPLRPAAAWPLQELWRAGALAGVPEDLLAGTLGLGASTYPEHTMLLQRLGPSVEVLAGSVLLGEPRSVLAAPSLLDMEDRRAIVAAGAKLTVASGGHAMLVENPAACMAALSRAVDAARTRLARSTSNLPAA